MRLSLGNMARHRLARLILGLAVAASTAVATSNVLPTHAAGGITIRTAPNPCLTYCQLAPLPTITMYWLHGVMTVSGQNFTPG